MASAAQAKQLKEHLQEQQEPFALGIYLSERGYIVESVSSNSRNGCCPINLSKHQKRSRSFNMSRILKPILYKLIFPKNSQGLSYCSKAQKHEFQNVEASGFSFSTVKGLSSFSPSFRCSVPEHQHGSSGRTSRAFVNFDNTKQQETARDANGHRKCMEEKHMNLLSKTSNDVPSSNKVHHISRTTIQENPSSFSFVWTENARGTGTFVLPAFEFPIKPAADKYGITRLTDLERVELSSSQHQITKVLPMPQKLLSDRANIYTETPSLKKDRQTNFNKLMGREEIGNNINEKTYSWWKHLCFTNADAAQLMYFSNMLAEWNSSQNMQRKIGMEIGDSIMDAIIEEIISLLLWYI